MNMRNNREFVIAERDEARRERNVAEAKLTRAVGAGKILASHLSELDKLKTAEGWLTWANGQATVNIAAAKEKP